MIVLDYPNNNIVLCTGPALAAPDETIADVNLRVARETALGKSAGAPLLSLSSLT